MSQSFQIVFVFILLSFGFSSCKKDKKEVTDFDKKIFKKLDELACEAEQFWDGFDYMTSRPIYIVYKNSAGELYKGIMINPPNNLPKGTVALDVASDCGLHFYRNDEYLKAASSALGAFGTFEFLFNVEGTNFFVAVQDEKDYNNFYLDYKNVDENSLPLLVIHEIFHLFQNENWTYSSNRIQDFEAYPLSENLLAHGLLLFQLMSDAYALSDKNDMEQYLKFYTAIRSKEIEIDPSEQKLVLNMGTYQEWNEGSARYVESFVAQKNIYPTIIDDPTHGWQGELDNASAGIVVRRIFAFRIWYHTGAIAIHMLRELGVDVVAEMKAGKTPYEMATQYFNLSAAELDSTLEAAKAKVDWPNIQNRAKELRRLL